MAHYQEEFSVEENTAMALYAIANAISRLGNADAATHFGALEALSMQIKEGLDNLAGAVGELDLQG